jgi:polysaccharide export outer membrane protein
MSHALRSSLLASALAASVALSGCASSGTYVWARDLPPDGAQADDYVIATGDSIGVRVYNQDAMSTTAHVRSDGKVAVPMIGDVAVRGETPSSVAHDIEERLKQYVVSPRVTVTVEESQPNSVSVLGEVTRPGIYTVDVSAGVLSALAAAGGFTPYASEDSIFVVRRNPPIRIRFTLSALMQADTRAATFHLRRGDVVVVQ